jgi:hypothetical protein
MTALPNYLPVGTKQAGTLVLGPGGLVDSASGLAGRMTYTQEISLPVTAVTNTDFVMSIPAGSILHSIMVYTTTAYTGTTANLSIGNSAAGAQYVTAVSIASIGIVSLTLLAAQTPAFASMPAVPNLFIRIAQSTTPTAVGAATLLVKYST